MSIDHDSRADTAGESLDHLESAEPGSGLVAALEGLEPGELTGPALASYLRGAARALRRETARLLVGFHHLGRAQAGHRERLTEIDEFSSDEIAPVMGWSRTMAERKLALADDLINRLPAVLDAMWDGRLDETKAARFAEATSDLYEDHAWLVCDRVLPAAPELPIAELIERLTEEATALDPDWALRRKKRAEKNARVVLTANPTGTATFAVCDLDAPTGLDMTDRVWALAAAVRALGVLTPIAALRAQVTSRLLDGSTAGLTDRDVAAILAAEYHAANPPPNPDNAPDDD